MRLFGSKPTLRPAKQLPAVMVTSYNLGAGFEERHKLVSVEAARLRAHVVYRPNADLTEDLVVARHSPLEELACWAAEEALEIHNMCPKQAKFTPTEPPLLGGAFSGDVEDRYGDDNGQEEKEEDLCARYSPENSIEAFEPIRIKDPSSPPRSPADSELGEWMRSQPEILLAATISDKLMPLEEAKKPDVEFAVWVKV